MFNHWNHNGPRRASQADPCIEFDLNRRRLELNAGQSQVTSTVTQSNATSKRAYRDVHVDSREGSTDESDGERVKRKRRMRDLTNSGCQFDQLFISTQSFLYSSASYIQYEQELRMKKNQSVPAFPPYATPLRPLPPVSLTYSSILPLSPPLVSVRTMAATAFDPLNYVNLSPSDFSPSSSPSSSAPGSLSGSGSSTPIYETAAELLYWQQATKRDSEQIEASKPQIVFSPRPIYPTPSPEYDHVLSWEEAEKE